MMARHRPVLYASENMAPVPEVTYTFNFTIAEPDASDDPQPEAVQSIAITTPPNKTTYIDGGSKFDRVGMVVTATLKASAETAIVNGYTVSPETLTLATYEVTITFGQGEYIFTATQEITVLAEYANRQCGYIKRADARRYNLRRHKRL